MRLDLAIVDRGLASSRNKATQLILDGLVEVDGKVVQKPAKDVTDSVTITVADNIRHKYVSRSAHKLLGLLNEAQSKGEQSSHSELSSTLISAINGAHCLDIGASTGGFTQVLLEYGAKDVVALDVGHGQLDPLLAQDKRVVNLEGVNFREVESGDSKLGGAFDIVVCDVSFISLKHIIPNIAHLCKNNSYVILLVKPQFEVGVDVLRSFNDAVITDTAVIDDVVRDTTQFAWQHSLEHLFTAPAMITGKTGNQEFVAVFRVKI